MPKGIARNTEDNYEFLTHCPGVETVIRVEDMITFSFDESVIAKLPLSAVPEGVYFNLSEPAF